MKKEKKIGLSLEVVSVNLSDRLEANEEKIKLSERLDGNEKKERLNSIKREGERRRKGEAGRCREREGCIIVC
jgi:hypothetical protein